MDKEYGQLELFSQGKDNNPQKARSSTAFLSYISRYERSLLIIIGFLITAIASFSLGVKKGKNYIMLKSNSQLDIASVAKPQPQLKAPQEPKQTINKQLFQSLKKGGLGEDMQSYTIQVASFVSKVNAQKEADILKNKGLSSQVLSKGKFCIVCVGNFNKREEAESLLSKLRKQYQDCRIRRL